MMISLPQTVTVRAWTSAIRPGTVEVVPNTMILSRDW